MLGNKSTWCNLLNVIKIILLRLLKILKILFMKISNKAPRFFVSENLNLEEVLIKDKNIIHQLQKVLRKKVSDEVVLLDGEGIESFGVIKEISKKEVVLEKQKMKIHQKENYDDAGDGLENFSKKIILAPVILKKDNFELVIQKCTEIGIKNFQPIISERTEKDNLNFERLEKISREASEQSEKIFLPKIFDTKTLEKFLIEKTQNKNENKIYALQFNSAKIEINKIKNFSKTNSDKELIFLVGPEGGWGEEDLKLFEKFNLENISLGNQILRSETASISLSSLLLL